MPKIPRSVWNEGFSETISFLFYANCAGNAVYISDDNIFCFVGKWHLVQVAFHSHAARKGLAGNVAFFAAGINANIDVAAGGSR